MNNVLFHSIVLLLSSGILLTCGFIVFYVQLNFPRREYYPVLTLIIYGFIHTLLNLTIIYMGFYRNNINFAYILNLIQALFLVGIFLLVPYLLGTLFPMSVKSRDLNNLVTIFGGGLIAFFLGFLILLPHDFIQPPIPGEEGRFFQLSGIAEKGFGVQLRDWLFAFLIAYILFVFINDLIRNKSRDRGVPFILAVSSGLIFSILGLVSRITSNRYLQIFPLFNMAVTFFCLFIILFFIHFFFQRAKVYEEHNEVLARQKADLIKVAFKDELTSLPNRKSFFDDIDQMYKQGLTENVHGIFIIDLDNFQDINESYGHLVGDEFLVSIVKDLELLSQEIGGRFYRIGGDEFGYISPRLINNQEAIFFADDLIRAFNLSFVVREHQFYQTVSIGAGVFPSDGDNGVGLVKGVFRALQEAKLEKNRYCFYSPDLGKRAKEKMGIIQSLRASLKKKELKVFYQPIMDTTGNIVSVEALVRWFHPEWGKVSPSLFIPLAETSGLILPLSDFVLENVFKDIHFLRESGIDIEYSINLSAKQLKERGLYNRVKKYLEKYDIPVETICFELTETALIDNLEENLHMLNGFNKAGLSLSIDDFGQGYSNLNYLRVLPAQKLKIDRCFVMDVPDSKKDAALLHSIIQMAKTLNLKVVAEGIEKKEQYEFMKEAGCDYFQGFYFSKAMPANKLIKFVGSLQTQESSTEKS